MSIEALKVKVISLPYIFQILYVLCFTWTRYQVSVYRTIGPLVVKCAYNIDPEILPGCGISFGAIQFANSNFIENKMRQCSGFL